MEYEASYMLSGEYYAERVPRGKNGRRLALAGAAVPGAGVGVTVGGKLAGAAWAGAVGSAGKASSLAGLGLNAGLAVGPSGVGAPAAVAGGAVAGLGVAVAVVPLTLMAVALGGEFAQGYRESGFTWKWGKWPGNYGAGHC